MTIDHARGTHAGAFTEAELAAVEDASSAHQAELEPLRVAATKGDLEVEPVALVWAPAQVGTDEGLEWVDENGFDSSDRMAESRIAALGCSDHERFLLG